jgi:hypothetical protein
MMDDVLRLRNKYKRRKARYLEARHQRQSDELLLLRRVTQNAVAELHERTMADLAPWLELKQSLTSRYNELKDLYNQAIENGDDRLTDRAIGVDEACWTLESLVREHSEVAGRIREINLRELDAESEVINQEIKERRAMNERVRSWIAEMQRSEAETEAELRSLSIRCELLEKKRDDADFNVRVAFEEAVEETSQGNERLARLLREVTGELAELDAGLGGSVAGLTLEKRLVSISQKMNLRLDTAELG